MALETVSLETLDGVTLEADVIWADTESGTARAFVVIGHPHPGYGGDRHNHVVRALQWAAHRAGCHSITPDFRGAGLQSYRHRAVWAHAGWSHLGRMLGYVKATNFASRQGQGRSGYRKLGSLVLMGSSERFVAWASPALRRAGVRRLPS